MQQRTKWPAKLKYLPGGPNHNQEDWRLDF